MLDRLLFELPDNVDKDKYILATYYVAGKRSIDSLKYAAALAVEQSTGTWLPVPEETPELREKHTARVIGIYEVPNYSWELPENVSERQFIIRIAFPTVNFTVQFAMLFTTVMGNISSSGKVKLLDLEFPESWLKSLQGPKFGVEGVRKLLNVPERPLVNNMIKPCTGLTPEVTARLAYKVAVGGTDIVKDDELIADAEYSAVEDRVKKVMEILKRADEEKGEKTLYAVNITDRVDKLKENAFKCLEAGANCLMVNYFTIGFDAVRMLTENPDINVPILAHPDFVGAVYESMWFGISAELIKVKLPRLAGLDMGIVFSSYGKFPLIEDKFKQCCLAHLSPLKNIKRSWPMIGGGTHPGHTQKLMEQLGNDIIIAAGGAIHGHPMGPTAGAKAFRQAIEVVMSGQCLKEAKGQFKELDAALDKWGLFGEQKNIFDLKAD